MAPPVLYEGAEAVLVMNPRSATDYKRADMMAADIRLNGARFLNDEYKENFKMSKWNTNYLRGTVRSNKVTKEAELDVWMRGAGHAMRDDFTAKSCSMDGEDCFFARVYAHIDSISESSGSVSGGQEILLEGGNFGGAK